MIIKVVVAQARTINIIHGMNPKALGVYLRFQCLQLCTSNISDRNDKQEGEGHSAMNSHANNLSSDVDNSKYNITMHHFYAGWTIVI